MSTIPARLVHIFGNPVFIYSDESGYNSEHMSTQLRFWWAENKNVMASVLLMSGNAVTDYSRLRDRPLEFFIRSFVLELGTAQDFQILAKVNQTADDVRNIFGETIRTNNREPRSREVWVQLFTHLRHRFIHRAPYLLNKDIELLEKIFNNNESVENKFSSWISLLMTKCDELTSLLE
ncbi:hypothetical protein HDU92_008820 [Lobulomyces angularis]|nr:hypothetical protein HDU92_008820 [Lobulomyces angularis]